MPKIYLSPSIQEFNPYIIGGNEEYYMNLITDAMIPHLRSSNIEFKRNNPCTTLSAIIQQSNKENCNLHFALYSNSSPENMKGVLKGPDVYYYAPSSPSYKAASIIAENLKSIYPNPILVTTIPTTILAELRKTKAPAVLTKIAYHDNYEDALWIRNHIDSIAKNLTQSFTDFFKI